MEQIPNNTDQLPPQIPLTVPTPPTADYLSPLTPPLPPLPIPAPPIVVKQSVIQPWHIGVVVGLFILSAGGYFGYHRFIAKDLSSTPEGKIVGRVLSSSEWSAVQQSMKDSDTLLAAIPKTATLTEKVSAPTTIATAYQQVDQTLQPSSLVPQTESSVAQPYRAHLGYTIKGLFQSTDAGEEPVDLTVSTLAISNQGKRQVDMIMNGSWGKLKLYESGMNALHISAISENEDTALVNIEVSDYLAVLLHRLQNPSTSSSSGVINFDTDEIYPYFGKYVSVPVVDDQPTKAPTQLDKEIADGVNVAYAETIGSIDAYLVPNSKQALTSGPTDELGIVLVDIDKNKLLSTLGMFVDKVSNLSEQHKSEFEQLCQGKSRHCLARTDYFSATQAGMLKASLGELFNMITIEKTGLIVDAKTMAVRGIAADITHNKSALFSQLQLSFSYYSTNEVEVTPIFTPEFVTKIGDSASQISSIGADKNNKLYKDNQAYIRGLSGGIWQAIAAKGGEYCNQQHQPAFCMTEQSDWNIYESDTSADVTFSYPLEHKLAEPNASVQLNSPKDPYSENCVYEKVPGTYDLPYDYYKDITTPQGVHLRLSLRKGSNDELSGFVCVPGTGGYSTKTPYAGEIRLFSSHMSSDATLETISTLLRDISVKGDLGDNWKMTEPLIINQADYPERKQIIQISPTTYYDEKKASHSAELMQINNADDNGVHCLTSNEYVLQSYGAKSGVETIVEAPPGLAMCLSESTCSICSSKGSWEEQADLSACSLLRCNMNSQSQNENSSAIK